MSEEPELEVTREGLREKIVGKAKEAAGELVGNDALAEAGREQQAEVDADAVAASTQESIPRGTERPGMSDLHVVAVMKAKPGSEAVLEKALSALVEPTRGEAGCISYELFQSEVDAGTFITIELWRSQGELDAHMQTPHVAQALQAAGDVLDAAPAIHPLKPAGR